MKQLVRVVRISVLVLTAYLIVMAPAATPDKAVIGEYEALKAQAERFYNDKSYSLAHETYVQARAIELTPSQVRWVSFRVADTLWRSQDGTQSSDPTKLDEARTQLEILIRDIKRVEDRDPVYAEVHESLGDFYWTRRDSKNWGAAWTHYEQALDWWAGAADIETARGRYLSIVWKIETPPGVPEGYSYGYYGNYIPLPVVENALKIAKAETDRAHAHFLIAMSLRQQGDQYMRMRVPEEFEAALKAGKSTDWYDDSLYYYGEWLTDYGRSVPIADSPGQFRQEPDYVGALALFRRLIKEFRKGETRYYDQANQRIQNITQPTLQVSVSNIFLPGSEIQFHLNWRNVKKIDVALYRVDLIEDIALTGRATDDDRWIESISLTGRSRVKTWTKDTNDRGDYKPGQDSIRVSGKLDKGAYVVEGIAGNVRSRDLILVSDASLVLKSAGRKALVYFCNAIDGSPIAEANVKLWEHRYVGQKWIWRELAKQTNNSGLAEFELKDSANSSQLLTAAGREDRQALSIGYAYSYDESRPPWRVYAFTDRPAYRPGDTVKWKFIARKYIKSAYATPSNETLAFEIHDPRGSKVHEGTSTLNSFGSAWGSLSLTDSMPLGEYRVTFWDKGRREHIGDATLFRIEEYKLPEFKVAVHTPEVEGKRKTFRLGDPVQVTIEAEYYFGGPVSDATVEVVVRQNPFYHYWRRPHEFPWFYEDVDSEYRYAYYRDGQIVKRETLKTDASGKAHLTIESDRNSQQDTQYVIEARVTDSSRREITGSDTVRVTRQSHYVHPHPQHQIYRPGDRVRIEFKALDANNLPVKTTGTVNVLRDFWYEIWLDPNGKEVKGDALAALRAKSVRFPPPSKVRGKGWRLKFRGYRHDEILTQKVTTNNEGEAELAFTPAREGYYRISWTEPDKGARPITANTTVWVATNATTDLGYRHGGVQIIVDKDTFRSGQKASIMLSVPTNDRYVLFTVEGNSLYSYQLVHVTGTVKLIELPIDETHVPNIFLSAAMVNEGDLYVESEQIVVPPMEHFLKVDLKADRPEYQPRDEGTLTVTTLNQAGKPVPAEVALGFVDESVYYIQQDYAGDPRQFYYGEKRQHNVQTQSTSNWKSYVSLVEDDKKKLIDKKSRANQHDTPDDADRLSERLSLLDTGGMGEGAMGRSEESRAMRAKDEAKSQVRGMMPARAPAASPPPPESGASPVQVRTDFRATAFWQPDVITDESGKAVVKVRFPDSLTTWKATARVVTTGNQFGIGSEGAKTNKPLIVRLEAPRFFVTGDSVTISAVINNNTDKPMTVTPSLNADGIAVSGSDKSAKPVTVAPHGESRVDWTASIEGWHGETADCCSCAGPC